MGIAREWIKLVKKDAGFEQENVYYCKDKSQILRKTTLKLAWAEIWNIQKNKLHVSLIVSMIINTTH